MRTHRGWNLVRPLLAFLALGAASCGAAPRPSPTPAFERFVGAFNARDLDGFMNAWEPDATIFFDLADPASLVRGRDAVRAVFAKFFGGKSPLQLVPVDVDLQLSGDVALLTFHLRFPDGLARRTIVWRWSAGGWHVWHLHASSVGN